MYNYSEDKQRHANVFKNVLNTAIDALKDPHMQGMLKTQKSYFDIFYGWESRMPKWIQLIQTVTQM